MLSLSESSSLLRERKISSVELTRQCLANIERFNPTLNAFITVTAELALAQAQQADKELANGNWRGPLHGVPVAIKDLIDVAGVPTTAASLQLRARVASEDADIVTRLKREGAVIVGKTNLHEFAFGGSGMVSAYGPARNPWDTSRITGGSSSGSAAAVAAGMCVAALGTDTAGSIRIPAALCGIVGHRPSDGVWNLQGVIPLRKSFDTVGPITRTVEDAALMFQALVTAHDIAPLSADLKHLSVGVARSGFWDGLDAGVATSIEHAIGVFRSFAESVADLELKVGVKWTNFDAEILDYHHTMLAESPQLYQPGTLERLRACTAISKGALDDAIAGLAAARQQTTRIFEEVDLILTPTTVVPAPEISVLYAMSSVDLRAYEVKNLLRNTAPFSLLFWPSISVPCGFTNNGLPIGLQISGRPGADTLVLQVARAYEQATAWHKRTPPVFA
jgi:Asp-tRNA(Asn)/Glu-tRNA(Gln) amidotransferase A subunit family amidase